MNLLAWQTWSQRPIDRNLLNGYAAVMGELEDKKESLIVKYHMALLIFSGETWKEGDLAFQDFKLLVSLRNAVVHMKIDLWKVPLERGKREPERAIDQYPKFIKQLREKKLIDPPTKSTSWLDLLRDQRVAKWVCSSAAKVTYEFTNAIPPGRFKQMLQENLLLVD